MIHKRQFEIVCAFLFTLISASGLFAQTWQKHVTRDNWGDISDYDYVQIGTCTGRGSSGEDTWAFAIIYTPSENLIAFGIYATKQLQWAPAFVFIDENVTISIREDGTNATQSFWGFASSKASNTEDLGVICSDRNLINALQRNSNFTVLIESGNGSWYIRSRITGNMPRE
jgi:hypothetical protein